MNTFERRAAMSQPMQQQNFAGTQRSPGGAEAKSAQARFIPREELRAFAAWAPGSLAGGPAPQSGVSKPAPPPPPPPTPEAVAEHLRGVRQSGYQDGYRDGLAALEGFKQSFATQVSGQVAEVAEAFAEQLEQMQHAMAASLAAAAVSLARQVVRSELAARPDLVAAVAEEAVEALLLSARHVTVRVHPADHTLVAQGSAEALTARGARLLADAGVARGGCLVESDIGVVDASIETRWRTAAAGLGSSAAWTAADTAPAGADAASGG